MLSETLLECSFSQAHVDCPCVVFVCGHFSIIDNVSGEGFIVHRAVFLYSAVA